jgi:ATP-dependent Lon protease
VLFICTANDLSTLSAPLRDRLEIIEVQGYTADEKVHIARRHLLPKQLKEHGIPEGSLAVTDSALRAIVRDYTREAGVRQLQREVTKLCRAVALEVARATDARPTSVTLDEADAREVPRAPALLQRGGRADGVPGVATGLAWTPVGGDILFIETSKMPGKGGRDHRPARRRDEGVGPRRAHLRAEQRRGARGRPGLPRQPGRAHPRPRRAPCPRTGPARA